MTYLRNMTHSVDINHSYLQFEGFLSRDWKKYIPSGVTLVVILCSPSAALNIFFRFVKEFELRAGSKSNPYQSISIDSMKFLIDKMEAEVKMGLSGGKERLHKKGALFN